MHNIHNLEQRWLKYKIKSYLPYFITIIFSIVLIITLYFIFNSKEKTTLVTKSSIKEVVIEKEPDIIEKEEKSIKIQDEPKKEIKDTSEPKNTIIEEQTYTKNDSKQTNKIILSPSLDFVKKLRTDSLNSYNEQNDLPYTQNIQNPYYNTQTTEDVVEEEITEEEVIEETVKKPTINISKQETRSDIRDVIKRFKKNNNPTLSLFVAKKYYKLGDYENAYNYALITNEINNDIEQSWLIFAKSLVKLNKKDKAIKTLSKYVRHSGSGNAKILLDDIKAGKFK